MMRATSMERALSCAWRYVLVENVRQTLRKISVVRDETCRNGTSCGTSRAISIHVGCSASVRRR
jgi:hypothetical protein